MVCTNTLVHMFWRAEWCTATQKAKQNNLWCTCWSRVRTRKKAPMVNTETSDLCSSSDISPCYSHAPHGDQQIANSSGLLCHQRGIAYFFQIFLCSTRQERCDYGLHEFQTHVFLNSRLHSAITCNFHFYSGYPHRSLTFVSLYLQTINPQKQ